ncbi:hypothetical protein MYX75_06625 [Acidobacteria bacterium AH-259-A15]|nr:hypothetical protein [Acidobacteria bacterium AH-259-A15]
MGKVLPLIFFLLTAHPAPRGSTLRVRGNGFSFSVTEPEGWSIDFQSAAQIANFVMHPKESNWREANVVAFARLTPMRPQQSLKTFMQRDLQEFQESCPFYEIQDVNLDLRGPRKFLTKALHCPGVRHEIVAVTHVPGFFVTFILSSNHQNELHSARSSFQDLLSSFLWFSPKSETGIPHQKK